MDVYLALAWMLSGVIAGLVLGLWLNPSGARHRRDRARAAATELQQRRLIDKLKTGHEELSAQLASSSQRHDRQTEMLRQAHAAEMRAAEVELRHVREQLHRLASAAEDGHVISGTAFVATRFEDNPPI